MEEAGNNPEAHSSALDHIYTNRPTIQTDDRGQQFFRGKAVHLLSLSQE